MDDNNTIGNETRDMSKVVKTEIFYSTDEKVLPGRPYNTVGQPENLEEKRGGGDTWKKSEMSGDDELKMSSDQLEKPPHLEKMNNSNNINVFEPEFDIFHEFGLDNMDIGLMEADGALMEECNGMELYASDAPPVIACEGTPIANNQMDVELELPNPDKPQYALIVPQEDNRTLTAINGGKDEMEMGFDEPVYYTDLTNSNATNVYSNPQPDQQGLWEVMDPNVQYTELEPDTKEGFAQYMNSQGPIDVYRMETAPQPQYNQFEPAFNYQKMEISEDNFDKNYLPSPSPACTPFSEHGSEYSIDAYYSPRDNNTNYSPSCVPTPRSRKYSTTSSCGGKMGNLKIGQVALGKEKPYRSRKTKAEMQAMTQKEKEERKKEQNRLNAKNCVSRKNGNKSELKDRLPILENNMKVMIDNNGIYQDELVHAYDTVIFQEYSNNSMYGSTQSFIEQLEYSKEQAVEEVQRDNNANIIQLKELSDAAVKNFKDVEAAKGDPSVPQNTYASRKSRAKTLKETAELKYKTTELEVEIQKYQAIGEVLEEFAKNINPHLVSLGGKRLPEKVVYMGFQQFEPS